MTAQEFKYTHYMTLKEWKQWKENFEKPEENNKPIKEFLSEYNNYDFDGLIAWSFSWNHTPQGYDYWEKISQRTKPVTKCKK